MITQVTIYNRLFSLPDVLIDYIYSYDDNAHYQHIYKNILRELLHKCGRTIINKYLSNLNIIYSTYESINKIKYFQYLSPSQYILKHLSLYNESLMIYQPPPKLISFPRKMSKIP